MPAVTAGARAAVAVQAARSRGHQSSAGALAFDASGAELPWPHPRGPTAQYFAALGCAESRPAEGTHLDTTLALVSNSEGRVWAPLEAIDALLHPRTPEMHRTPR